jgi:hypothetical protein
VILFKSLTQTVQTFTTTINLPNTDWYYVYCPIPNSLKRKVGTFKIVDNDISLHNIYLEDFEFTNQNPTTNDFKMGDPVLSIELIDFTANYEKGNSILNWQTANEKNSDHFNIERSTDGKQFIKIGEVKAFGTTNQVQNYNYLDASLPPQYNVFYYRLQQVDKDNKAEYSPIRSIRIDKQDKFAIKIYPNPNNGQFVATISASDKETEVSIQNSRGQVIWKGIIEAGQESRDIQLDQATNGLYFVSCRNSQGSIKTIKFVVNR